MEGVKEYIVSNLVTLKTVILTFYYEYELIITHTSSLCKSNISAPHFKLSKSEKIS